MKPLLLFISLFVAFSVSAQKKETFIYSIKGNDTLKLDIYTPNNIQNSDTLPVLLWMHGGGFSGGSRDYKDEKQLMKYAAEKENYIGVSISYRLLRKETKTGFGCDCTKDEKLETFKQAVTDYMDAAKYIVEHASELHINPSKIIAGGSSAGAEGILNAVFMRHYFLENADAYEDVHFAGVFSCAGAVVDASYISPANAVPSVLFHGTKDQLVPFGNAPHHYCAPERAGYIFLDGSEIIANALDKLETAYYFHIVKEARHEIAAIPFNELDKVFDFFDEAVINDEIIQTKIIKNR